ncbi:MAG TPA: pepsin/retropepsin-like aspartic protease family protein [Chthonomonadales bacterium]|nr:pepsin/retropepsin-like aspartic protease family protein [Chthonomonadales bacterium]
MRIPALLVLLLVQIVLPAKHCGPHIPNRVHAGNSRLLVRQTAADRVRQTVTTGYIGCASGLIVIATVNLRSALLLMDTGTNFTVLSQSFAAGLKLPLFQETPPVTLRGYPVYEALVATLQLGAISFSNAAVVVGNDANLDALAGRHIDGILGTDLLKAMAVRIDFWNHTISFLRPGIVTYKELKRMGLGHAACVPMFSLAAARNIFTVPASVNHGPWTDLSIDSGASETILPNNVARNAALTPDPALERESHSVVDMAPIKMLGSVANSLRLGGVELRDAHVRYEPGSTSHFEPCIGMDVLRRFDVLMDFPSSRLFLEPLSSKIINERADRSRKYIWRLTYSPSDPWSTVDLAERVDHYAGLTNYVTFWDRLVEHHPMPPGPDGTVKVYDFDVDRTNPKASSLVALRAPRMCLPNGLCLPGDNLPPSATSPLGSELESVAASMPVPEHPVKVGDRWSVNVRSKAYGDVTIRSRLIGIESVAGVRALRVRTYLSLPQDPQGTDRITIEGDYDVDPPGGVIVRYHLRASNIKSTSAGYAVRSTFWTDSHRIPVEGSGMSP